MTQGLLETPQTIVSAFLKRAKLARIGVYLAFAERTERGASFSLVTNVDEPKAADGMRLFMLGLTRPETINACAKALYDKANPPVDGVDSAEWDELPEAARVLFRDAAATVFEALKNQSAARLPAQTIVG